MQRLVRKAAMTVLGVALMLGFWTVRGWLEGNAHAESASRIPEKVWNGGGAKIVLEEEASDEGTVSASFETRVPIDDPKHKMLETWEKVGPGKHSYTIDVPPGVGGYVEMSLKEPKVGSSVRITVKVGDRVVGEDSSTLDSPLKPGYGFAAQVYFEDYATGKLGED